MVIAYSQCVYVQIFLLLKCFVLHKRIDKKKKKLPFILINDPVLSLLICDLWRATVNSTQW